jgi:hypothetical protein
MDRVHGAGSLFHSIINRYRPLNPQWRGEIRGVKGYVQDQI